MNRTNCPNCGAPLNRNHECNYCGTIVHGSTGVTSSLSITASGIKAEVKSEVEECWAFRDEKGMLHIRRGACGS